MPSNRNVWHKLDRFFEGPIAAAIRTDLEAMDMRASTLRYGNDAPVCSWCGKRTREKVCPHCGGPSRYWDVRKAVQ